MTNTPNPSSPPASATGQAAMNSNGDHNSTSSQHGRKRDKIINFFRTTKSEEKAKGPGAQTESNTQKIGTASTEVIAPVPNVNSLAPRTPNATKTRKARSDIFTKNESRPTSSIEVPKIGARISSTPQLALCSSLLTKTQSDQGQGEQGQVKTTSEDAPTNQAHLEWIKIIENDTVEQDHIRWLETRMVEEFSKDAVKDSAAITEVLLLGSVLDREHYRKLLNCFISEFEKAKMLDVHLLHGLIQLVQCASDGYLVADDLVKIMSILRAQLQNTHQQSTEHPYHLALAVSRLLDVMAEHKVQDVSRVEEYEPLSEVLSGLRNSTDPFLMYQASYAYQALQYVPDDETALQAVLRHSAGVVDSLVKISGVVKMDLGSVLEGLKGFQEALSSTYDIAKTGYEGFRSLIESGRGVLDSLKEGLGTSHKRPWYAALRAADGFVQQGQLAYLNKLIVEAPCRLDPLFQWGICQLLGEIAVDETWEVSTRQQAMDLIVHLYSNDLEWAQDASVNGYMLAILVQLGDVSDPVIKGHAKKLMDDIKNDGCEATPHPYPLKTRRPIPEPSPLLTRVQRVPYVEYDLHQLKRQRLEEEKPAVYIPPMAKSSLQAPDSDLFPLMEKVMELLASERQVILILGDSGAGKSTFNRHLECELWREYKSGGEIPLFINMPALSKPENELIAEQLRMHNISEDQIQELKLHRQLIVICDGYDESQLTTNIHTTNQLNRPGQWNVKLVMSCRSQYLGREYRDLFVPQGSDHYSAPALDKFQEAVITPFSTCQIKEYVEQFVPLEQRTWVTEDYMEKLTTIPNLMDLVTNPFLLILSLGALPSVVEDKKDLTTVRITRVALYDSFVKHWIGANKRRLQKQRLEQAGRTVLTDLSDDFEQCGIEYQKDLAAAIFQKQDGKPFVDYSHMRDRNSWKSKFFGPEPEPTLLRSCSLLNRVGNQYRFIHRSILEYFFSRFVYEPLKDVDGSSPTATIQPISHQPLSQRDLVKEPSIIQFLSERVQEDVEYKKHLLSLLEQSKTDPGTSQAASNAITILTHAGVMFNGADLHGIRVPGANLSGGQFDSAQLQGADLSNTNLRNIWLRQADLSKAHMTGVQFGEWPFLQEEDEVECCAYSPNGRTFVVGLTNGLTSVYETATWEKTNNFSGHTSRVTSVVSSPSGHQIASGSDDKTVRLWDVQTGGPGAVLSGHTSAVTSVVFSPSGHQIASGSRDKTVRLWDAQTGGPGAVLRGHTDEVTSVVFSPSGYQIASSSWDETVRLWDAQTGESTAVLSGHSDWVTSVVFSPCGHQIASGSRDYTVRVWDAQTGVAGAVLSGHTNGITSVVFSPSGLQVASGSWDDTVRLWDAQTGGPSAVLSGHTKGVTSVVFSPSGHQIASGSWDETVRLWDAQTGGPGAVLSSHTSAVTSLVFSPSGHQIASGSWDNTVRFWDAQTGGAGAVLSGHTEPVTSVVFSPSGHQIASGSWDETVRLWDAQTGGPGAVLSGHTHVVRSVVFSPSGHQIASGSYDKTVRLWDAQTGEPGAVLRGHTNGITSVVFSPSGHQIASGSDDDTVRLWDAQTGGPDAILRGHTANVTWVVFSPSGNQIASGSRDETVRLWDAQTGGPDAILSGHTDWVTSVVFSPNGHQIASGSRDGAVRLWDAHTGGSDAILSGHAGSLTSLVFSPSGEQIAAGSSEKTVRIWGVESRQCLTVLEEFHAAVTSIAWSAKGGESHIATGCENGSVRLWKVANRHLVRLRWSSMHDRLTLADTIISDVQGLSKIHTKLLEQRGAVGQPVPQVEL